MSKKPYDFLASEKEPLLYLEKSMIRMKDGFLCALQGEKGMKIISPSGHLILLLGTGTSISQEAAIFCSLHDMQIAFVKGGTNIHSLFMSGRYSNPQSLINQVKYIEQNKIELAKKLLIYRLKLINDNKNEYIEEINKLNDLNSLLLWEARWAKTIYRKYSLKSGIDFKRDFEGKDKVNERLNILNNVLYSVCAAIILSCSLSPSIAILHGVTRRGGLAFDYADIFKTKIIFDLAFSKEDISTREMMYKLSMKLKENNYEIIKTMIKLCLHIAGDEDLKLEDILL